MGHHGVPPEISGKDRPRWRKPLVIVSACAAVLIAVSGAILLALIVGAERFEADDCGPPPALPLRVPPVSDVGQGESPLWTGTLELDSRGVELAAETTGSPACASVSFAPETAQVRIGAGAVVATWDQRHGPVEYGDCAYLLNTRALRADQAGHIPYVEYLMLCVAVGRYVVRMEFGAFAPGDQDVRSRVTIWPVRQPRTR